MSEICIRKHKYAEPKFQSLVDMYEKVVALISGTTTTSQILVSLVSYVHVPNRFLGVTVVVLTSRRTSKPIWPKTRPFRVCFG